MVSGEEGGGLGIPYPRVTVLRHQKDFWFEIAYTMPDLHLNNIHILGGIAIPLASWNYQPVDMVSLDPHPPRYHIHGSIVLRTEGVSI